MMLGRVAGLFGIMIIMLQAGCGPSPNEKREALELARLLRKISPEMKELVDSEINYAAGLRITLEEAGSSDFNEFRLRFDASVAQMSVIKSRRKELQVKVRQGGWITPLVRVAQGLALTEFDDQIARIERWISLAQDVRFRADLGRRRDFPEVETLKKQLEIFMGEVREPPLSRQLTALVEQYNFKEADINP